MIGAPAFGGSLKVLLSVISRAVLTGVRQTVQE
jgi:hypothetical protein